jgi:putative SOS response-associated peptidase YedK
MRWGLIPSWAKEIKGPLMINARVESVTRTVASRRLIPRADRRALLIADGLLRVVESREARRGVTR